MVVSFCGRVAETKPAHTGTCWMPWLHIYGTWTISDTFVYMIHMQLCFLGAPQPGPDLSQGPSSEHASLVVSHMSVLTGAVSTISCLGGSTSAAAWDTSCIMMPPAVLLMVLPCTPDSNQLELSHSEWKTTFPGTRLVLVKTVPMD